MIQPETVVESMDAEKINQIMYRVIRKAWIKTLGFKRQTEENTEGISTGTTEIRRISCQGIKQCQESKIQAARNHVISGLLRLTLELIVSV